MRSLLRLAPPLARSGAALLALTGVLALGPVASPAAGFAEPPVVKKLPNGLEVAVFPRPGTGFVQVQLTVEAGTAAEGPSQRGAAPIAAQMLQLGTTSRSAATFGEDLDRIGGSLVANASRENAVIAAAFLPEDAEAGLELLSDAILNPIFDEDPFEKTRNQAVRELVRLHSDPVATAEEQLWSAAMPDVPAARAPLGDLGSLFALTRESVRSFHRDAYRPDRAVLAIAGDLPADRAFALATEWFGRWAGKSAVVRGAAGRDAGGAATRIVLIDRPEMPVASVRVGWSLPGRDAADDLARTMGASLFGEAVESRLSGRLPADAGFGVSFGQLRDASLLDVRFFAPVDSTAAWIERVRRAARQTREAGPDAKRLAALGQQVRASYPMRFATVGGAVSQWVAADAAGGDAAATLASYPSRAAALDAAAVGAALQRDWNLDRAAIVVIGPAAKLRGPLARLGTVTERKLDQPPAGAAAAPADTLAAPTAAEEKLGRERIARAIAAHGGLEKLRGIRDIVSEARIRLLIQGRELRGELRQMRKEPFKMVYLTSFETFESRQVLNGDRAWSVTSTGQLQDADSTGVRALRSGFNSDVPHLLLAAGDPATQVADRGTQRIGTQDLWAVDVLPRDGQRRRLYFDPATAHLVAVDQNEESARTARLTTRRLYRDLRTVSGLLLPYEEERQLEGQTVMNVFVTRLDINSGLGDDEFQRPTSMPAAPVPPATPATPPRR